MERGDEVVQEVEETVPFEKVESKLKSKIERDQERRKVVGEVEDYTNHVITGGGKRFRIAIPYLMAEGLEVDLDEDQIIESFVPIELGHGLTLVLDDVIDEDESRRGMVTPHTKFEEMGFEEKQAESLAILDVVQLQSKVERLAFDLDFLDREKQIEITQVVGDAISALSRGQMLDVAGENLSREERYKRMLSEDGEDFNYPDFYEAIITGKTVPLFKAGPKILEIITGREFEDLKKYAENLGKAFQIRDDVLDISAGENSIKMIERPEENGIGKDRYSDLKEGSVTLPVNYAFQMMEEEGWREMEEYLENIINCMDGYSSLQAFYEDFGDRKELLSQVLQRDEPGSHLLQIAGKVVEKTGALEEANERALSHAEKAVENLKKSEIKEEYEALLEDMAYFAATRSK